MRMDDGHINSLRSADYLEARANFLAVLHYWTDRLPRGVVDIQEEQTEEEGYVITFDPANENGCWVRLIYYGTPADRVGGQRYDIDLLIGDGKRVPTQLLVSSPLSLEPVLEVLEAARQGRISQYWWPCHIVTEIRLNSKRVLYKDPLLPFLVSFDELLVKRLLRRGPRRAVKYEGWAPTDASRS